MSWQFKTLFLSFLIALNGCVTGSKSAEDRGQDSNVSESRQSKVNTASVNVEDFDPGSELGEEVDPAAEDSVEKISRWCDDLRAEIKAYRWAIDPCEGINYKIHGNSVEGRPLLYAEFGNPASENTTLIFSMVHADEITPLYLGLRLSHWLRENEKILNDARVVVAPLVNPDGFFRVRKTRVNSRGVDLNRNFKTQDWHSDALKKWKGKYSSNPRRFPGHEPESEPETAFQKEMIQRFQPQKILSVHAPLGFVDYDGPNRLELSRFPANYVKRCQKLRSRLRAVSGGFFPGSLGNFAGRELGIPTITLELPTAAPRFAKEYWKKFQVGIKTMIRFEVPPLDGVEQKIAEN